MAQTLALRRPQALAIALCRDAEATSQRFVLLPTHLLMQHGKAVALAPGLRMPKGVAMAFRTGDLGLLSSNGMLHLHGRLDLQVKINGGP